MKYGERKGGKPSGEYTFIDLLGLGTAAAGGIAVATFLDLTQSQEASALFLFNDWIASASDTLGLGKVPLYGVVLILMALGGLSTLLLQPVTLRGAFAQGAGLLAFLVTLAPSNIGQTLPSPDFELPQGTFADDLGFDELLPEGGEGGAPEEAPTPQGIVFEPAMRNGLAVPVTALATQPTRRAADEAEAGYNLRIKVVFTEGLGESPAEMIRAGRLRGKLHNETTSETYNLFRNSGADLDFRDDTIYIATRIPGDAATTSFVLRVEADGYRIVESRLEASQGVNPIWSVEMQASTTPLFLQRLSRPYWF